MMLKGKVEIDSNWIIAYTHGMKPQDQIKIVHLLQNLMSNLIEYNKEMLQDFFSFKAQLKPDETDSINDTFETLMQNIANEIAKSLKSLMNDREYMGELTHMLLKKIDEVTTNLENKPTYH